MTPRFVGAVMIAALFVLTGCSSEAPLGDGAAGGGSASGDWSAGRSDPVSDPMYPEFGHADIDVLHYGLTLDYRPDTKVLSGTADLAIRPVKDLSVLQLDFSDAMNVQSVTVDGEPAEFTAEPLDLSIEATLKTDEQTEVVVSYSGTPELVPAPAQRDDMTEGLGASVDPASGALWTFQEPYGALTWYPVNDQPSDEALYDFSITVPDGYSAVASGTFEGQDGNTFSWSSSDPVASYLTTLAVDRYQMTEMTGPDGLPVTTWIPPQYQDFAPILDRLPELLTWLADRYGPFPFASAGVVLVGGESAMETQQMITFSGGMVGFGSEDYVAGVVVHEMSHQWFGDAVTPQDWTGLWLSEGAATYTEQMWNVDAGTTTESAVVSGWESEDATLRSQYGPPGAADPGAFASSNSYVCPALMLYRLRDEVGGADAVDEFLAAWVSEHHNQSANRDDFIEFANTHFDKDLTGFFDEWLDSETTPK